VIDEGPDVEAVEGPSWGIAYIYEKMRGDMERSAHDIRYAFTPAPLSTSFQLLRTDVGISLCGSLK